MAQSNYTTINDLVFPFKNYVLALPGWYPTWLDPLPGDFNQRHIIAAGLQMPQIVLYIGKDQSGMVKKVETRFNQLSKTVIEIRVIYPSLKNNYLDAFNSNLTFFRLLNKFSSLIKKRWGPPILLHSYIVIRGGLAGLLLSKKWKLPFVLTENWTIYYPEDPGYLPRRNKFFRWTVNKVYNNLTRFLPVTQNLQAKVTGLIKEVPYTVIPNVVETGTFYLKEKPAANGTFRFIHVSTMIYQKNPEGLLRGFKAFNLQHPKTLLLMVGPYEDKVLQYARQLGLGEDVVKFTGAVPYKKVAELLFSAEALVLFSRYENLPCVILEAFCCGIPVISTKVGGIAEVINNENGILITNEKEDELIEAFTTLYSGYNNYNREKIASAAFTKFSCEAVGQQINQVYEDVLSNNKL